MCKYCERPIEELDSDNKDVCAQILTGSPILKRKGLSFLQIDHKNEIINIKINYCPICGKKL